MKKAKTKPVPKGIKHHAKKAWHATPKFIHGMVAGAFVGIVVMTTLGAVTQANALSVPSPRDCDSNAVINCGALSTAELQQRYSNPGVASIYNYFKITAGDINTIGKTAVAGQVHKDGTVVVGNKTVATKAVTAGRLNITGSTQVTSGGVTFYTRPPSVSFRSNSLAAFVVMEKGQFKFAILAACGNPVSATPVPKPTPAPTPPPETPETPPSTQTPESTPTPPPAPEVPAELPKTGPSALIVIAGLSILGGYVFHMTHRHVRTKKRGHHA